MQWQAQHFHHFLIQIPVTVTTSSKIDSNTRDMVRCTRRWELLKSWHLRSYIKREGSVLSKKHQNHHQQQTRILALLTNICIDYASSKDMIDDKDSIIIWVTKQVPVRCLIKKYWQSKHEPARSILFYATPPFEEKLSESFWSAQSSVIWLKCPGWFAWVLLLHATGKHYIYIYNYTFIAWISIISVEHTRKITKTQQTLPMNHWNPLDLSNRFCGLD